MVFKDVLVNYSKSSKERLEFIINNLKDINSNERVIFVGNTFYTNDLNLSSFVEFINVLNQYGEHDIFIQDVETLSAKLTETNVDSWYSIPTWPGHVSLYLTTEEIDATSVELRGALKYKGHESPDDVRMIDVPLTQDEVDTIEQIHIEHEEDLIGSFIDEVNDLDYTDAKKASIVKIGLDALLRR